MTTRANRPTYSLATTGSTLSAKDHDHKKSGSSHRRRGSHHSIGDESDQTDGNASLTYSANSSVNSGGSAAGESTDSSFADIMRVLDLQDSNELKLLMKKEGLSSVSELRSRRLASGQSVTSSLAYSTDGESHLEGSQLLQTIAGQPSDGFGYDGADFGRKDEAFQGDSGLMFAPAEPGMIKKKKKKTTNRVESSANTTPKAKPSQSHREASPSPSVDTPTKEPPSEKSTPPPHPRKYHVENAEEDDEVWYAKWWMLCFPDAARNLMPKR